MKKVWLTEDIGVNPDNVVSFSITGSDVLLYTVCIQTVKKEIRIPTDFETKEEAREWIDAL